MMNCRPLTRRALALLLCLMLLLGAVPALAAVKTLTVSLTVTTYQNRARAALKQINALRKAQGVGELQMLAELEDLSIQRAAELFVFFDHDRPDLTSFETAEAGMASEKTRLACAECIAAGYSSAEAVMEDWGANALENLLDPDFTHVGVACVQVKGSYNEYYWELYLTQQPDGFSGKTAATTAKSGKTKSLTVELAKGMFSRADQSHKRFELRPSNVNMKGKQNAEPSVYLYDRYDVRIGKCKLGDLSFKSSNNAVFTVKQSGVLTRKKAGTATLTVGFDGLSDAKCTVTVGSGSSSASATTVTADTIGDAKPELDAKEYSEHTTLSVYLKGASGYVLYRSTSKSGTFTKVDEKTTTKRWSVKLENDDMEKTYYYKVRAYKNKSGRRVYSEYSTAVRVTPLFCRGRYPHRPARRLGA